MEVEFRLQAGLEEDKGKRVEANGGKGAIAAAVNKQIQRLAEGKREDKGIEDIISNKASQAYIMSLFEDHLIPAPTPIQGTIAATGATHIDDDGVKKPHVCLSEILKKAAEKKGSGD